jgi:hypothetical protein
MGKPMSKAKNVRMPTPRKLSDDNKRLLLLPQVQANNRSTRDRSMPTPCNKHLRHQLPLSSNTTMTHLVPTDYVQETSSGTSSVTALKCTTLRKPT